MQTDEQVVAEAQWIILARIKEGSMRRVPLTQDSTWEHQVILTVTEVLKGPSAPREIPVTIHYGLDVLVSGLLTNGRRWMAGQPEVPAGTVDIVDHGGMAGLLTMDIRKDHLWFLAPRDGRGRNGLPPAMGITEPGEIQTTDFKPFYQALLSDKIEEALKKLANDGTPAGRRALELVNCEEVRQIALLPDRSERVRRLMPIFLMEPIFSRRPSGARGELTKCGSMASRALLPYFHSSGDPDVRSKIIGFWTEMKAAEMADVLIPFYRDPGHRPLHGPIRELWSTIHFTGAEPLMIEVLEQEERYWSLQALPNRVWDDNFTDEKMYFQRSDSRQRILNAVKYLGQVGTQEQSIQVLQKVWERWMVLDHGGVLLPAGSIPSLCKDSMESIRHRASPSGSQTREEGAPLGFVLPTWILIALGACGIAAAAMLITRRKG